MKIHKIIFILLSLFVFLNADGQNTKDLKEEFAFVSKQDGSIATDAFLNTDHYSRMYQYKVANAVFEKLVEARGDFRMKRPTLTFSNAERRVAAAKPKKAEILLELKAYEICTSFGADSLSALASLLAHELIHYYEKHDWTNHFAKNHSDFQTGQTLKNLNEGLKLETQADYLGGFLAYSAGYPVHAIMPQFLSKVYAEYGLPDKISGYPSLWERKKMAQKSAEKLQDLVKLYDMANTFIVLEQYKNAKIYLDEVARVYQSREIYNNLGVAACHAAMKYMDGNELKYAFPLELDSETRLQKSLRGSANEEAKQKLLKEAWLYFEQAIQLDENYVAPLLNIACVFTFLKNYEDANYYLSKATKKCVGDEHLKSKSDILVLKGILASQQDNKEAARDFFQQSADQNNLLASTNLKILLGTELEAKPVSAKAQMEPSIDGIDIDQFVKKLYQGDFTADKIIDVDKEIVFGIKGFENSNLAVHMEQETGNYTIIQSLSPLAQDAELAGIKKGSSLEEVYKTFHYEDRRIESRNGSYLVFYKNNLVIELNPANEVKSWSVFRIAD